MAIITMVSASGTPITGSTSGNVAIDDAAQQLIVRDGSRARILIGSHPVDGHAGIWVSKDGVDVIDELKNGN